MTSQSQRGERNLDLIQMVQRARMLHDAGARPSQISAVYWIEAKRGPGDYPPPSPNAGEWRVPLHVGEADEVWERVKALTIGGQLGYKSKISTAPAGGQAAPDQRMLCVRTYDAGDAADVERVGRALREIGLDGLDYIPDK